MSKLDEAITFAAGAHAGQRRAGGVLPYIVHPLAVMQLVALVDHDKDMLIAAVLHDVLEDTATPSSIIERRFGAGVLALVIELTTPEREGNRAARNQLELERLAGISERAATVKLADISDNLKDIRQSKPDFATKYVQEKIAQYDVLAHGDVKMKMAAAKAIVDAM